MIILGAIFAPVAVPGSFVAHSLRSDVDNFTTLLWDSRGVDGPRSSNLMVVTLACLTPFFFHGLKKALPFSDHVEAYDPWNLIRAGKVRAVLLAMLSAWFSSSPVSGSA